MRLVIIALLVVIVAVSAEHEEVRLAHRVGRQATRF